MSGVAPRKPLLIKHIHAEIQRCKAAPGVEMLAGLNAEGQAFWQRPANHVNPDIQRDSRWLVQLTSGTCKLLANKTTLDFYVRLKIVTADWRYCLLSDANTMIEQGTVGSLLEKLAESPTKLAGQKRSMSSTEEVCQICLCSSHALLSLPCLVLLKAFALCSVCSLKKRRGGGRSDLPHHHSKCQQSSWTASKP